MVTKNLHISYLLDFYGDALTEKQREVMEQYYNDDLSLAEIAENFGITRQGVRDAIKRGEGTVLELEEKIGFARRYRVIQDGLDELEHLARDVNFYTNGFYAVNEDVRRLTDEMLRVIQRINEA